MPFFSTNNLDPKRLLPIITSVIFPILSVVLCFAFADIAKAEAFNVSEYLPLDSGIVWTYSENGLNTVTTSVLPGYEYVNGIQTKVLLQSGGGLSGTRINITNDSNGIREHKEFSPMYLSRDLDFSMLPCSSFFFEDCR